MIFVRHLGLLACALALYTVRSGRWWVPALVLVWGLAALFVMTAKVVVPTAVYTLF